MLRIIQTIETQDMLFIVMEFYRGGDLQNYMCDRDFQPLSEETTKRFARKLGEGLMYLHSKNIIHRDLKPENLLLSDVTAIEAPIIADFGLAKHLPDKTTLTGRCGTKGYMAPEILAGHPYSLPADIWAFGTLLYALVSSQLPFPVLEGNLSKDNIEQFCELIMQTKLRFKFPDGKKISKNMKDLLRGMLEKDQANRLTIEDVLEHPWFQE